MSDSALVAGGSVGGIVVAKPKFGDDSMHERMSGSSFLPRIQLMTSSSRPVQFGKTKMGNYCLVKGKDEIVLDYGPEFSALVITWRPKAMDFTIPGKAKAYYNPEKPGFKNVENEAEKPFGTRIQGYMYGPEYLVYVPQNDAIACFHFSNVTMRMRAGEMKALLGKAGTFRSEIIDKNQRVWPGPVLSLCSTPLNLPAAGTPEGEEFYKRLQMQVDKFQNPPDEEVEEVVEEEVTTAAGRER